MEDLLKNEGWEIVIHENKKQVKAYGAYFPIVHPFSIYGKLLRTETNPELRFQFMKKMHDFLWPQDIVTWNYWSERRFRKYAEGHRMISWSSGGSTGKSVDAAKIAVIEYSSHPALTGILVVSTTIESLKSRVFGYISRYIQESAIKLPFTIMTSPSPKIQYNRKDDLHAVVVLAAPKGKDNKKAISNYIGRHPKHKIVLILDEGPDLDTALLDSIPNLELGSNNFQCLCLGNASSKTDLHGALSTPKVGWENIDPTKDTIWETNQKDGICLFFNCNESPAIHEKDPIKKKALSKFLITKEQIEEKKKEYGENSDLFYRQVLGFWKDSSSDPIVISEQFLKEFTNDKLAEWSGVYPLHFVAGLDPAFSTGGDSCVLRIGMLGHTVEGHVVLDFRGEALLYRIPITVNLNKSADLQIADKVIEILKQYNIDVGTLCVDATGQGRALGEVIRLRAGALRPPIKIYSTKIGHNAVRSFDVTIKTNYELWFAFREFLQHGQIKGLDKITLAQLGSRLIEYKNGKNTLETKASYKTRMGAIMPSLAHSPDEADAAALALQSAIINYGFSPGQRKKGFENGSTFEDMKLLAFKQATMKEEKHVRQNRAPLKNGFNVGLEDAIGGKRGLF